MFFVDFGTPPKIPIGTQGLSCPVGFSINSSLGPYVGSAWVPECIVVVVVVVGVVTGRRQK